MDWSDSRPLAELNFAIDAPAEGRAELAAQVRSSLARAGVVVADDIDRRGCTGLIARGLTMEEARFVRANIGGCGHALPCFVGIDRFCLVHDVVGGLQDNQAPLFPEHAAEISRDLTDEERAKVALVERARRVDDPNPLSRALKTRDLLAGREGLEPTLPGNTFVADASLWRCPNHTEADWSCRFCLAAEIVAGPFEPSLLIVPAFFDNKTTTDNLEPVRPSEVAERLDLFNKEEAHAVGLFVQAARFTRKLAKGWS
jgi:hypothetical protein